LGQISVLLADLTLIADNDTRWNSTYLIIIRGLLLKPKIPVFSKTHKERLGTDFLSADDWVLLQEIQQCLKPFWNCTIDLQSNFENGKHRAL
jgi:hypothetical protein